MFLTFVPIFVLAYITARDFLRVRGKIIFAASGMGTGPGGAFNYRASPFIRRRNPFPSIYARLRRWRAKVK